MTQIPADSAELRFPALTTGQGLDVVKIVAALAMVVDHAGHIWLGGESLYTYLIGRIAMPLFCFAAAVSILRLRDHPARLYRQAGLLFVFALVAEPVSRLTRDGYDILNVLFTLSLAMAVAPVLLKRPAVLRAVVYGLGVALVGFGNLWEFGFAGMVLPLALAFALHGRRMDALAAVLLAAVMNFSGYVYFDTVQPELAVLTVVFAVLVPFAVLHALNAVYAKRGQKSRLLSRYALHVFYPLHMLVLWALRPLFGG